MIRAVIWKEWREQRTIALAVLTFGVLALALTAQFADPRPGGSVWGQAGARELMALSLGYLAGAVCGAVLLADEKEVGTLEFLDSLPSLRRNLWLGKVVFGLLLVIAQCVALALLAIAMGCVDERMSLGAYASLVVFVGLLAFAWGLFGGALARSTLGAVFQGSVASMAVAFVLAIPFVILFGPRAFGRPFGPVMTGYYTLWLAIGVAGSWLIFTTRDRERSVSPVAPARGNGPRRIRGPGVRALVWLTARQAAYVTLGALAAGAVLGAAMLAPDVVPVFLWTGATLAFGVLAGVTTLGEEQTRGVARFWSERRLPLGRLWLTKVAFHMAIAVVAAMIAFLPLFAAVPGTPFRSRLLVGFDPGLRNELPRFLFLALVYGFVVGHLAGMLFRKAIVGGLAALVVAAVFVALVLPGVIGGGAAGWQVWAPAIVVLLTARLVLYPWATERVLSRGPALRAAGGVVLAFAVLGVGLAYRVYQVPDVPDRLAESGFESSLPPKDVNSAGRDLNGAVAQFGKARDLQSGYPTQPSTTSRGSPAPPPPIENVDPLERVANHGWKPESRALGPWLDRVFAEDWVRLLDQVADAPIGVYHDPRDVDYFSPSETINDLGKMAAALRARGMQLQEAGDDEAYVRLLRGGLAAVRTARYKSGFEMSAAALRAEEILLAGLTEWLQRMDRRAKLLRAIAAVRAEDPLLAGVTECIRQATGRADLLRTMAAELARHEREMPVGSEDTFWAEQMILRNTMERVGVWLPRIMSPAPARRSIEAVNTQADAEADLVALAWTVPWERIRRERILRAQTHRERIVQPRWLSGLELTPMSRAARVDRLAQGEPVGDRHGLAHRRLARIQVALRLYQLGRGEVAMNLDRLVPDYLPQQLEDPYSDKPFRYRVSNGEVLVHGGIFSRGAVLNPEFGGAAVVSALAHPIGGVNGAWAFGYVLVTSDSTIGMLTARITPTGPPPEAMTVQADDAVLWSVGPDSRDDGGLRPIIDGIPGAIGQDWIVVVPTRIGKKVD